MPRTRRKTPAKFVVRRILLALSITAAVVLLGFAGWNLAEQYPGWNLILPGAGSSSSQSEPPADSAVSSEPVSVSVPEPESSSEPEPPEESEPKPSADDWELLLANPSNPLPEGYVPELETVTDNYRVDARIADSVKRMFAQAKEDGISLVICSAYRSVEYQQTLFDNKSKELMDSGKPEDEAVAVAATIIAVPGTSEHHTGLAMDIVTPSYTELDDGFAETPAFAWLSENAANYGFVMRYPKDKQNITKIIYEPWHYRYVGVENAVRMKAADMCLEEYVNALNSSTSLPEPSESAESSEDASASDAEAEDGGEES